MKVRGDLVGSDYWSDGVGLGGVRDDFEVLSFKYFSFFFSGWVGGDVFMRSKENGVERLGDEFVGWVLLFEEFVGDLVEKFRR